MDKRVNYAMIGGFVVILGFMLLATVVWLSTSKEGDSYVHYKVHAREDVSGLSVASSVRYSGVAVGSVESIEINPEDEQEVSIVLKIKKNTPITTSTVASLVTEGITGVQFVGLKSLKVNSPRLLPTRSNKVPTIPDQPSLFVRLSSMLDKLAVNVSGLATDVRKLVNKKNRQAVSKTLDGLSDFAGVLSKNSKQVDSIIGHMDKVMLRVEKATRALPETIESMNQGIKSAKALTHSMKDTSDEAQKMFKSVRLTTNQISTEVVPSLTQMLRRMMHVTDNLQVITHDVRQNPAVLLRGQAPLPGGPGE